MNFRHSTLIASVAAGLSLAAVAPSARATLIANFNFNDSSGVSSQPADFGVDRGAGTLITNFNPEDVEQQGGSTVNAVGADEAGRALALVVGSGLRNNGRFVQFAVPTTGFEDVAFSYAFRRISSGFAGNQISYSTDGGATFTAAGPAFDQQFVGGSFEVASFDASAVPAVDDQPDTIFRVTFSGGSGDFGNTRVDNVQVNGTTVPEPAGLALLGAGGLGLLRRRRHA